MSIEGGAGLPACSLVVTFTRSDSTGTLAVNTTRGGTATYAGVTGADVATPAIVLSRRRFAGYWEYLIEEAIFIKPVPSVKRVVFIATPHRGLMMGNRGGALHLPDQTLGARRWATRSHA